MTMFEYVWLYTAMYYYIIICMTMYDYVWMTVYDCVWWYMAIYDYVCLYMISYDYVWLYMTMYEYVWLCHYFNFHECFKLCLTLINSRSYAQILCLFILFPKIFWFTLLFLCNIMYTFSDLSPFPCLRRLRNFCTVSIINWSYQYN